MQVRSVRDADEGISVQTHMWIAVAIFSAVSIAMFALVLKYTYRVAGEQKSARNRRRTSLSSPGLRLRIALHAVAGLHLAAGIGIWIASPGAHGLAWSGLLIGALTAAFWSACAEVTRLAGVVPHASDRT